jgi:hypothetical protein|nr:MAG TPA: hypothetical protein [Caudoviricetes sp.]
MTQYRLKHDLPNAKAGDIFEVDEGCVGMFKINKSGENNEREYFFDTGEVVNFGYWFQLVELTPGDISFKPVKGDYCWYLNGQMVPAKKVWIDDESDNELRNLGLIFKTGKEAYRARVARLAKIRIQRAALQTGFKPKWDQLTQTKWYLVYNLNSHRLVPALAGPVNPGAIAYYGTPGSAIRAGRKYRREYLLCLGVIDDPEAPLPEIDNDNDNGTLGLRQNRAPGSYIGWEIEKRNEDNDEGDDE